MHIKGLLFDKDGTLFDFRATWDVWAGRLLRDLSQGDLPLEQALAEAISYDHAAQKFLADSPVIAGTNREAAELLVQKLPDHDVDALDLFLAQSAATAPLAPAVPLAPFLTALRAQGLSLGVMTNDTEHGALAHLKTAGVVELFDFIAGADSGFGAKPDPDPLLAFASKQGLSPETVAMVGDSTHDLLAGRRAGMRTIGVLTGIAKRADLTDLADVVLPDIGHIPAWLDQKQALVPN
ncbi:MAG: HAD family hydrolase [Thalassovita sp.]